MVVEQRRSFRCGALVPVGNGKRVLVATPLGVLHLSDTRIEVTIAPHVFAWLFYLMNFAKPPRRGTPAISLEPRDIEHIELAEDSVNFRLTDGRHLHCLVLPPDATPAIARLAQRQSLRIAPVEKITRPPLWG